MSNTFKMTLISGALVLLAGCGGGGGGEVDDGRVAVTATAGEGGTISPGTQRVTKGGLATLTVQPSGIYDIQSVTGCAGSLSGTTYQTGPVNADCTVTATFKLKPLTMTLSGASERIAENATTPLTVRVENAKNSATLTAKVISGGNVVTVTPAGTNLFNLVTKELDREASVELEITAQDGTDTTRTVTQSLSISVENTSFSASLARYKVIAGNSERILALSEEKSVSKALNDAAAILALKNNVATTSLTAVSASNTTHADLETEFNKKPVDAYIAGTINDTELTRAMNGIETLMAAHVAPFVTSINSVMPTIAAQGVPAATAQTWLINPEINTVSLFVGNSELGQVTDGKWVFKPGFQYINGLINSECAL
jgi:hypothetical protein